MFVALATKAILVVATAPGSMNVKKQKDTSQQCCKIIASRA
jgi:hypothetical protein